MKRILLLLLITSTFAARAQVYNNEWIDYSKTYYKFKIGATGLYRINQPVLSSIGLGATPVQNFQLWRNGQEIPIYTSVQAGTLGGSDYIEFWGEMNDGKPDNVLFRQPDYQLNDKYSMETDTACFFLTVNAASSNLRLVPTANNITGTLTPEPYFMHTAGKYFKDRENTGRAELVGDSYTYSSSFEWGEGWSSQDISEQAFTSYTENNLHVYTGPGAPGATFKVNASGNAVHARYVRVKINGDSVLGETMNYYDYIKASAPVSLSLISSGTAIIEIRNMGTELSDRMVVAQSELVYPRQFDFGGASNFYFELPANTAGNYLEISGFNYSGPAPVLYDLTNGKRYDANTSNPALLKIKLDPSAVDRKLLLVNEAAANIALITSLQQRNFANYGLAANQGDFIIIAHPYLTNGPSGTNPVENYRAYRSSVPGGSFNAKVYMINELIDQFGLGIKTNPLAVRNFLRWIRANYNAPLKNILLMGKGVVYLQSRLYENDPNMDKLNLIPPFGHPASDNLLSAVAGSSIPLTPIGRISAINGDEIAAYLQKVKEYEQVQTYSSPNIADKSWMKEMIHVVGASDDLTLDILLSDLEGHRKIIEDTFYGGHVNTFAKNTADYVQQAENDRLTNLLNNGIGILTYFGHSSSSTLEFNLDNPLNYNNQSKYPVFIVMGCNAGNFFNFNMARFTTKETLSEKYVLAPERGSIAFLASTHLGIVHYLDIYNTQLYTAASITKYGKSLGEIMDEAINRVFDITTENDFYARFQCEQFTLHGDPALKMYNFAKPDYAIEESMVKVSPAFITVGDPNFKVKASFMNIGKATGDSVVVEMKRTLPSGTFEVQRVKVRGIRFLDSLTFTVNVHEADKGLNKITITLDPDNVFPELYENNNTVSKDVFIYEDEARPIFPYDFSIVNYQNIKLVASSANPFAALREYKMEIDTTEAFNSPLKVTRSVSSAGGVFEFTPGITLTDSTVYYWRVSPTPTTGSPIWNTSSFIYLNGPNTGFNQSQYFQHGKSKTERMSLTPQRNWTFDSIGHNIFIKNGVYYTATLQEGDLIVSLDGDPFIRSACEGFSLIFNLIDPNTFRPVVNTTVNGGLGTGQWGTWGACYPSREWNFELSYMNVAERKLLMDLMDSIPTGYYVAVRNILNNLQTAGFIDEWKNDTLIYGPGISLYHKLKAVGFTDLDSFTSPRAFAFLYKKGDNSFTPKQTISEGLYDLVTLNQDIKTPDTLGFVTSPLFGPSKGWQELRWRGDMEATSAEDSASIDVIGVKNDASETVLFSGVTLAQQNFDVSSVDAKEYPFMKLRMRTRDSVNFTPYQLRYWRLYYLPVPEGAVAPNLYFTTKDTVEVGESFNFGVAFKNISNVDFDSVKVKMVITDKNNLDHPTIVRLKKLTTIGPDDTIRLNIPVKTDNISGHNTISVNFNPDFDQPEQYLPNNFVIKNLYVRPDSLHPVMDVTFDGVHILNRDIVSSKPDILIKLKDEAKWMVLNDTSLMNVVIRYPDGTLRRFSFDNDTLQFHPAAQAPATDNTASITLKPYFTQDGDYELLVTGKDRSNNGAGNVEYRVGFQVINKPMISNMLNYPNPFTTSTAFVFTITGSDVPQNIRIQILTITGKIVRDITKEELGPLHIGRNITSFKWDGTDQYGQKLANGIYLYRVITNLNGKSLDKYKADGDDTDKYFNKGYGKMYLMR